jgi:hypothetical protein
MCMEYFIFWDVTLCGSCKNQCFGETCLNANFVPSSPILVTPMMEVIRSSEALVFTRAEQDIIPEDGILHSQSRENLKSYKCTWSYTHS